MLLCAVLVLYCLIPTSNTQQLEEYPRNQDENEEFNLVSENGYYSDLIRSIATKILALQKANQLETNHQSLTNKRGWDFVEKIWQPQFPKRAWEFVDRVWKIPKFRKKYLRYLQPNKRSEESWETPAEPQTGSPVQKQNEGNFEIDGFTNDNNLLKMSDEGWLFFVKDLFCRCCSKNFVEDCCSKCKFLMLSN